MTASADHLEQLATEHATLADAIHAATARQKEIRQELAQLGTGQHAAGPYTVHVTIPRRFDDASAAAAFPFDAHPEFYAVKFDRKAFEHATAPTVVDEYRIDGATTVTVK